MENQKISKDNKKILFSGLFILGILLFLISMYFEWYQIEISYSDHSFTYILFPFDGWIRISDKFENLYQVPEWNFFMIFIFVISIFSVILLINLIFDLFNNEKFKEKKEIYQLLNYFSFLIPIFFLVYLYNNNLPYPTGFMNIESVESQISINYSLKSGFVFCFISSLFIKLGYEGVVFIRNVSEMKISTIEQINIKKSRTNNSITSLDRILYLWEMEKNIKNQGKIEKHLKELMEK